MIGIIIIGLLCISAIWMMIWDFVFNHSYDTGMCFTIGCFLIFVLVVWITADWYRHKLTFPNEYIAITETIKETKELINIEKELNLEDMEIHRSLSDLIKERQELLSAYRIARKNPFVIFKPVIPDL